MMPGLLSSLFAEDETGGGGASGSAQSQSVDGDAGIDLSPTVGVESEMGGSHQNLDGSTTDWSSDTDVTLTADVDATLDATGVTQGSQAEGDGM